MGGNGTITPGEALLAAAQTGPVTVVTKGSSMLPHLDAGRRVSVERQPLRFGDLAAFVADDGRIVVHRYVGRVGRRLLLLGDANPRFDPLISPEQIVGRVVSVDGGAAPERYRFFLLRRSSVLLPRAIRGRWRRRRA